MAKKSKKPTRGELQRAKRLDRLEVTTLRSMARTHTTMALNRLVAIAKTGKSEFARVAAATVILERGWGKPTTEDQHEAEGLRVTIRHIVSSAPKQRTIDHEP